MINRKELLKNLQRLLRLLEVDLRERCEVPDIGAEVKAEYDKAKKAERTAQSFEDWRSDYITQIGAAWILSCVFARFLEDNQLVDPPKLSGPGERLQRARDEYDLYVHEHPAETVREYLLSVFDALAKLPGAKEVFGGHNLIQQQRSWLGGDAAKELRNFWQRIDPETGALIHDFTDPDWDTRFLGDLYQDLSEAARKKYALLQTPEFVEEFILERTLEPALDEFGLRVVSCQSSVVSRTTTDNGQLTTDNFFKMIDPACGSGHFLLGSFDRILRRWQKKEPGTNTVELVQRTLHSIHGVDVNPYAVAIARFRLLVTALKACEISRLADAPAFEMNLACGDSLYHGRELQLTFEGIETDESHYFATEDAPLLRRILREGTYHCVVANPPYITPKDKAANQAYRRLYLSCHRQYALTIPFMERIFRLNVESGFCGQITGNAFITAEFGKKLIEEFFPTVDLTIVADLSGARIPGHGIPTVLVFGRNRRPVGNTVRCVLGIRGDSDRTLSAQQNRSWRSIVELVDIPGAQNAFVSVQDAPRSRFHSHPWTIGGGGAAELKERLDQECETLLPRVDSVGFYQDTHADDFFVQPIAFAKRQGYGHCFRPFIRGEHIRDWAVTPSEDAIFFPYDDALNRWNSVPCESEYALLHCYRTSLWSRTTFGGGTYKAAGRPWFDYHQFPIERARSDRAICYAFISTHNHYAVNEKRFVFGRTAPLIRLKDKSLPSKQRMVAILNSSTACFWMKQVAFNKGDSTDQEGARTLGDPAFNSFNFNGAVVKRLPVPSTGEESFAIRLTKLAKSAEEHSPNRCVSQSRRTALRAALDLAHDARAATLKRMICIQEDLDWECYRLYGLLEEDLTYGSDQRSAVSGRQEEGKAESFTANPHSSNSFAIALGERAFEIVLARKMARGEIQTTWFERHGSTPITEFPEDWPDDYKKLVERRIEVIETNPQIALIEQPEYKRRWNTEPWDSQVERALRTWLLDRLESYFDFDGRMKKVVSGQWSVVSRQSSVGKQLTTDNLFDIQLVSVARLADIAARDEQFMEVGEVYRDRRDFDVTRLVADLVADESVPLLRVLRYKPVAMDKRLAWERTWDLQRQEDGLSCQLSVVSRQLEETKDKAEIEKLKTEHCRLTTELEELDIPVPPKYKSSDFQSSTYWRLRGKLDVPKERWVSFPHCEGEDQSLVIAWAGYDHLQLTKAISAYFADVQEKGGSENPRLVPLLGCILELNPWVKQWYNDVDPDFGYRLGDYFANFVEDEARTLGKTVDDIRAWTPPAKSRKRKKKP